MFRTVKTVQILGLFGTEVSRVDIPGITRRWQFGKHHREKHQHVLSVLQKVAETWTGQGTKWSAWEYSQVVIPGMTLLTVLHPGNKRH